MSQDIPAIEFQSGYDKLDGIEILRLEDILVRSHDHYPEQPHQTAFYAFFLYTNGNTRHLIDFVSHDVQKNSLVCIRKGQVNAFRFAENVKGYAILFTQSYFEKQFKILPESIIFRLFASQLFSPMIQIPQDKNVVSYFDLLFQEFYNADQTHKETIVRGLFTIIVSKIEQLRNQQIEYKTASKYLYLFIQFENLIKHHFTTTRNADFYAKSLGITYKHLNHICKEVIQKTAKQCIDDFIILEAKRNLINSGIKSTELTYQLGFTESTNFVKYFKKHTGLTPNQFKKLHSK
ncbi:helix-turn-helix domain-containing protein [Kordia sp.]|uniref:helix-turn-helix domain-containing protein n=1 Tax=Kordia sp. TaxID=1965332 RepID=UPI0025BACB9B|nr:helix-turn-helix domain-containing protein [Kordia sp.]MCH2196273.1 helix-turn-helix domain-containing protein [Kordia sp.]